MNFSIKSSTKLAIFWIFLVLLLSALSFLKFSKGFNIETNILKMLPYEKENQIINSASDRFSEMMSRDVVFIINHKVKDSALVAASMLRHSLNVNSIFAISKENDWFNFYFDYRFNTIPASMEHIFDENSDFVSFRNYFYSTLFSPMANIYGEMLNKDPLMLFPQFVNSITPSQGNFDYQDGNIIAEDTAGTTVLISAVLNGSGFEKNMQADFNKFIHEQDITIRAHTGAKLNHTGVIAFSSHYLKIAKFETSFISLFSFLIVFLLLFFAFRSLKCLFWGVVPLIVAILCGLTASLIFFDKIHIISVTMGTCLIGICIDYSFHYISEYSFYNNEWNSFKGLKNILPGITMGFITTSIGYLTFFFVPFTGLKQIAAFTVAGMAGAYLTVILLFPVAFKKRINSTGSYRFLKLPVFAYIKFFNLKAFRFSILFILLLVIMSGLPKLTFIDDIKIFEMETDDLNSVISNVKNITGTEYEREFLLIKGSTQEELLQNIEKNSCQLDSLRKNGVITDYLALTKFVPSIKRQNSSYQKLSDNILANKNNMLDLFKETGFRPEAVEQLTTDIKEKKGCFITLDKWLNSSVSMAYQKLYIGEIDGHYFSVILLNKVKELKSLEKLINDDQNIYLINNNSRISHILESLRKNLVYYVFVIYLIFLLILILRYGFKKGLTVFTSSIVAFLFTISVLSLFSIPINIMHILALILVLALGIDYSIFLAESVVNPHITSISIILSAATTVFSFGMLAFSRNPALKSMGITIIIGICVNLLLSPLAADRKNLLRTSNEL